MKHALTMGRVSSKIPIWLTNKLKKVIVDMKTTDELTHTEEM